MEVIGSVSAIAGVLSIAGQTLDGMLKLRAFFQDCAVASNQISSFLHRLNSLIQVIVEVKDLIGKLNSADRSLTPYGVASLNQRIRSLL